MPDPKLFRLSAGAETQFMRALRKVGRASGLLVETYLDGAKITNQKQMEEALKIYSEALGPWATRQAQRMMDQVMKSNARAYRSNAKNIAAALNSNRTETEARREALRLINEQVGYIKSIPLDAGLRAQKLALEAFYDGTRADEIAKELMRTTSVSEDRALLIAQTETARANAKINQVRAMSVGSTQYRWRNSSDGAVRESHRIYRGKKLDGMVFSWNNPPTLDDGTTINPGETFRCRCYAEVLF